MSPVDIPPPLYIVTCDIASVMDQPVEPLLMVGDSEPIQAGLFDERLLPALIGIRYALHLPKTRFDTLDLPLRAIDAAQDDPRKIRVLLAPTDYLKREEHLTALSSVYDLILVICPPASHAVAREASRKHGFTLPAVTFDELSQETLDRHWNDLTAAWSKDWPGTFALDPAAPRWTDGTYTGGSDISFKRMAKLLGMPSNEPTCYEDPAKGALDVLELRMRTKALIQLEDAGTTPEECLVEFPKKMRELMPSMRARVSLCLPGVAPRYRKKSARPTSDELWSGHPDVLSLLVAHDSTACESMGVLLPAVPDSLFHALAALEQHWIDGPNPAKVRTLLRRLDVAASSMWSGSLPAVVGRATSLHAFTNFPIGLLTLPGDTAPLATRAPIAYRTVNPLTRALQIELTPGTGADMSGNLRILIAECIPESDPVGSASRVAWGVAVSQLSSKSVSFEIRETLTCDDLRAAIADYEPSILIISAHGFQDKDRNVAGLVVGEEHTIGVDLGEMPPLVILSACHTGPRGGGVVAVSDMLIAAGATAVLSTLVPVSVFHNSDYMVRFLVYLSEATQGREPETNVMEVWHRVQTLSVVTDMFYGNQKLGEWAHKRVDGESPTEEFMLRASKGRLRPGHTYQAAEDVLVEIADRRGQGDKVRAWLQSPGYVPESMMYTMVGYPELIQLRDIPIER